MKIDRCVCFNVTFAQLHGIRQETGANSVFELQGHALFGHKCQMCHVYVKAMLQTGQTVFTALLADEAEETTPLIIPEDVDVVWPEDEYDAD